MFAGATVNSPGNIGIDIGGNSSCVNKQHVYFIVHLEICNLRLFGDWHFRDREYYREQFQ